MRLDELRWQQITENVHLTTVGKVNVFRLKRRGSEYAYTIQPDHKEVDAYTALDPITAQAVLFELTREGNDAP